MQTDNLDSAIQNELRLIEAIKQHSRRLTAPLLIVLVKTFVPPVLVFLAFVVFGPVLVPAIVQLTGGFIFPNTLYIAGMLVTIFLVWRVWQWSEARFGGLGLMRRLNQVTIAVFKVERAIDAARARPEQADLAAISRLTQHAWGVYQETMRAYGFEVE